jgi:NAD(P)-dependent dehydrogenase (short-subunit alcohol dehydrogenase family)
VLVTGGSRGIGAATAAAFAALGDRVALHYGSSRERAEAVVAGLAGRDTRSCRPTSPTPRRCAGWSPPRSTRSAASTSS